MASLTYFFYKKLTFVQSIQTGDNKIVFAGGMESMSCSRHCIHARPGVKFGDVSMEDTLLKVGWILGKVWRYIYSGWVGYQRRFGDLFTQSGLNTREGLKIYLLKVDQILKKVWISMNDTLLKVGWKLGKVWRYIYIFTQGGLDTREELVIYLLNVGWLQGKVWLQWVGPYGRFGY